MNEPLRVLRPALTTSFNVYALRESKIKEERRTDGRTTDEKEKDLHQLFHANQHRQFGTDMADPDDAMDLDTIEIDPATL